MQTSIDPVYKNRAEIAEAESILRACVHCGFCTATCPTYQILGSELDSPRGRIYLIKELLEGAEVSEKTRLHLDRCLTCRSCETTCPSGVRYSRLVEIGRNLMEVRAPRSLKDKLVRKTILKIFPYTKRMNFAIKAGKMIRPLLPAEYRRKLQTQTRARHPIREFSHSRRMLVLEGCVQPLTTPNTNHSASRVLNKLGISLISAKQSGCCGAINQHLSDPDNAKQRMRQNIDAWWPYVEEGIEAIVVTASGCGLMIKEYAQELANDPDYAEKAQQVSALARDISEVLCNEDLEKLAKPGKAVKVAFQSPCTLQHGQKINGVVENILQRSGYQLVAVKDGHLCCGSAGTYSLLQKELSNLLLKNKLAALEENSPEIIATANVGCQLHINAASTVPVKHWIELLDRD